MEFQDVAVILSKTGLQPPELEILRATEKTYRCALLQPRGDIYASKNRIGGADPMACAAKGRKFLEFALKEECHVAVMPEYFFPWAALLTALSSGLAPRNDGLWILGCESITSDALLKFENDASAFCDVLFEPIENLDKDRTLFDPVALVFHGRRSDGTAKLVVLIQFKTFPSSDKLFFEESLLKRGSVIYEFRKSSSPLRLFAFICSDVLGFTDQNVRAFVRDSTVFHIQLNPNPRHTTYRQYRTTAFAMDPLYSNGAMVCLNWAAPITEHDEGGKSKVWDTTAGSTWYCPQERCTCEDGVVTPNHKKGLYYTYMEERRHALFFDNREAAFLLRVPKVLVAGSAVMTNRNGPTVEKHFQWNAGSSAWSETAVDLDPGYASLLEANPNARSAMQEAGNLSAIDAERLLALSAASVIPQDDWRRASNLDACTIRSDEIVRRVTVAQDLARVAVQFRQQRLYGLAFVRDQLNTRGEWPAQVAGLDKNAKVLLAANGDAFNIISADGRSSLVAYLGDGPSAGELESAETRMVTLLRRGKNWSSRVCLLYSEFGQVLALRWTRLSSIDDALEDETDLGSMPKT